MATFQVPQFIEEKPKIIGPFTLAQFLYLAAAAAISFASFYVFTFFLWILITIIVGGAAAALAFGKVEGQEMAKIAAKAFRIPEDLALSQLNYNKFVLDLTDDFLRHQMKAAEFAKQAGLLQLADLAQHVKGLYDPSLLKEAAPDRVSVTLMK